MNDDKRRHIAVHINELVLPHGSRMPDQAALRRLVEDQLRGRSPAAPRQSHLERGKAETLAASVATHVARHIDGEQ